MLIDAGVARPTSQTVLVGRAAECAQLEGLLQRVRAGQSQALVLRGERGIGKTVLLERIATQAQEFRVIRLRGVESEAELPYATLHLLCGLVGEGIPTLQPGQRDALETAIGTRVGPTDRFLVGVATLELLAAAAGRQPLLCIVDDAQWLDRQSAQALAFVARRLQSQPVAILMAERDPQMHDVLDGLPQLRLGGLSHEEARTVLGSVLRGPLDESVAG